MNRELSRYPDFIIISLVTASFLLAVAAEAQVTYVVTDLGSLQGSGGNSFATGVNNRGEVTVNSVLADGNIESATWQSGMLKPLPTLGGLFSNANGLNASGQIVGKADPPGDHVSRAVLWGKNGIMGLGTLGGDNSEAVAINNKHQIVGNSEISPGSATLHSFFWTNGNMTDLNTLGGNDTFAFAINQREQVTGQSDITTTPDPTFGVPPYHGFLWERGVLTDLGGIFGGKFSYGDGINNRGEIAGSADLTGDLTAHAYILLNGSVRDLGTLPVDTSSGAFAINNQGQAVGISALPPPSTFPVPPLGVFFCPCHAVLWENSSIIDLNTRIPANSGFSLLIATAINDRGRIVGQGFINNNFHAFLLTPLDETSGAAMSQPVAATVGSSSATAPFGTGLRVIRSKAGRILIEKE